MLRTCTITGCETIVFGSGTCVEHDAQRRPLSLRTFDLDVTRVRRDPEPPSSHVEHEVEVGLADGERRQPA